LRAYGGFDHPNLFGCALAVSLILAAYMLARKRHINSLKDTAESIFLFIFYFFGLLALLFTFSRTSWLAIFVGLFILAIILTIKKDRWAIGRLLALMFFSAIFSLVIFFSFRELFEVRLKTESALERISIEERQGQIFESKELLKEKWLFGAGIGNYTATLSAKSSIEKKPTDKYQPVHNAFILLWAEGGVFVLIFFLAFFISLFSRKGREDFSWALLISLMVLMIFDHWLFSLPFGTLFLFFIFGML
jgi:O-antigen ligase